MHKKGVSEMVSYALLVIIAVGASVLVYGLLSLYVPKDKPTCPQEISLSIQDYKCSFSSKSLEITYLNKGNFKVDAVYVRFGLESKKIKSWINNPDSSIDQAADESFYFMSEDKVLTGLLPGNSKKITYDRTNTPLIEGLIVSPGNYGVEIVPAVQSKDVQKLATCDTAIVKQPVVCS